MTYRDWNQASPRILYYKDAYEALQRALETALRENCVKDECLEIAVAVLKRLEVSTAWKHLAARTLTEIEARLAELEPEEES